MPNITLYVKKGDLSMWKRARRLAKRGGLSAFVTRAVTAFVLYEPSTREGIPAEASACAEKLYFMLKGHADPDHL